MSLLHELKKISLIFFLVLGLIHFLSGMLYANGYSPAVTGPLTRIFFLPFLLSALFYGFTGFRLFLEEIGHHKRFWNYLFLGVALIILIGFLSIEFFVKNL